MYFYKQLKKIKKKITHPMEPMIKVGYYNDLVVEKFTPQGAYLTDGIDSVLLPGKYITNDLRENSKIRVFVYCDSLDRPVATTGTPLATADQFAVLTVKEQTSIGVFLDWGLEKDLLVPYNQMAGNLLEKRSYVFRVLYDEVSNRVVATNRLRAFFEKNIAGLFLHQKVSAMIYENSEIGSHAIIEKKYTALFHRNEFKTPPAIGSVYMAYITKFSLDSKIDISLAPAGPEAIMEVQNEILKRLEKAGGFLPINDDSSPEEIRAHLAMSKKTFKMLLGNLMKKNLVEITPEGIRKK